MLTLELSSIVLEIPNDAYKTLKWKSDWLILENYEMTTLNMPYWMMRFFSLSNFFLKQLHAWLMSEVRPITSYLRKTSQCAVYGDKYFHIFHCGFDSPLHWTIHSPHFPVLVIFLYSNGMLWIQNIKHTNRNLCIHEEHWHSPLFSWMVGVK